MNLGGLIGGIAGAGGALLGPVGAALGGGISSAIQGVQQQRMSRDMMNFQDTMSRTQYQRAVADMQAAGLNPMLAYSQGGNVSPSGAMGSVPDPGGAAIAGYSSASSAERTRAETMPTIMLQRELEERIGRLVSEAQLNNAGANAKQAEYRSRNVTALIDEKNAQIRSEAEAAEFFQSLKESKLQGEITDSQYGEGLRYIDRAMDLLRGVIGGASAYSHATRPTVVPRGGRVIP